MNRLSEAEIMHVASLARIDVTKEEIDSYAVNLKSLLNEIEKINDIKGYDDEMLITPVKHHTILRRDQTNDTLSFDKVTINAPKISGNYIEVPVMVHE